MRPRTVVVELIAIGVLLSACSNAAVSKAVGTGRDGDAAVVVRTSQSAVSIENHAGRPLLNVRVTITDADASTAFVAVVPTIDTGATNEIALLAP